MCSLIGIDVNVRIRQQEDIVAAGVTSLEARPELLLAAEETRVASDELTLLETSQCEEPLTLAWAMPYLHVDAELPVGWKQHIRQLVGHPARGLQAT